MTTSAPMPGVPAHMQPYAHMQGQPGYPQQPYQQPYAHPGQPQPYPGQPQPYPGQPQPYPGQPQPYPGQPQPYPGQPQPYPGQSQQVSPGALYQFQPAPQRMSLTGQVRLFEVDEIPAQYKIGAARRRWFTYIVAALIATSVAAGVTFFIIRSVRESAPATGTVRIESVPPGAEVTFDGERRTGKTPVTIESVPTGTRHSVKVELPRHKPFEDTVDIPNNGGEVPVTALLKPVTGKLQIITSPAGAEIILNGINRGRTPATINDVDLSQEHLELRLKDYQPYLQELSWPANGTIQLDIPLKR